MQNGAPKLVMLTGPQAGRTVDVESPTVIGRHPDVRVRISDNKASREHSKIFKQGDDWFVVDLNSRNGTLVNDSPVTRRALRDRDEILIGETRMRFEMPAAPAPPAPDVVVRKPVAEVIDLRQAPAAAPAGAIQADQIQVKERALQFSKNSGSKKGNPFFEDLSQRPFYFQILMILVVLAAGIGFIYLGMMLAGIVGGGGE